MDAPATCPHCGSPLVGPAVEGGFCCRGCAAAFALVRGLGLERYYERRCIDPKARALKPDAESPPPDYAAEVRGETGADGTPLSVLHLLVEGLHCGACVWLIESVLTRQAGVVAARLNMTTHRLTVRWRGGPEEAARLLDPVTRLGYRLVPYDPALLAAEGDRIGKDLLKALAVAGFAAGNIMLLSVSVWAGHVQGMGPATRDLMHWLSALIALPAVAYAGLPFFRSAAGVLRAGRTNMDVPISLGVLLASGMSLAETIRSGPHAYFDAAVSLLFFLLVGRYLDHRARGRARATAERLLGLAATAVAVIGDDGVQHFLPLSRVRPGMTALAAAGERIGVDGTVVEGTSEVDTSLVTGETVPVAAGPGERVFAGTLNLAAPLRIRIDAVGEDTLLAGIVRLMEAAEQGRARYVAVADRVARWYAPVVHVLALGTFLGWTLLGGLAWQEALLTAVAVLIITCPCALALAVPVVQVVASGRLMRQGILVKSGTAFERLAVVDTVVFDKTGTLTLGRPELLPGAAEDDLRAAAALAGASRHPLARALCRAVPGVPPAAAVREVAGQGLVLAGTAGEIRLGGRAFAGPQGEGAEATDAAPGPELWLARPGRPPVRFAFADRPRPDAAEVVAALKRRGLRIMLLSGDRAPTVAAVAAAVGIDDWRAGAGPADKCARLAELAAAGRRVLMVGDGLNDAPALAAAHVSLSPSTAVDVSQTAADVVFQGDRLGPVVEALAVAGAADRLVRQNFALALLYNVFTIPLAVAGLVTPLIAAIAMSTSSILVIGNALRLGKGR